MITIEEATARIVQRLEAGEVSMIPTVGESFFTETPARNRTVARVLSGKVTEQPLGFDATVKAQLVVTVVLSILNGVACSVITEATEASLTGPGRKWTARRLRRKLTTIVAPQSIRTVLPTFGDGEADSIGRVAERIAGHAGLSEELAKQVGSMTAAILSAPDSAQREQFIG